MRIFILINALLLVGLAIGNGCGKSLGTGAQTSQNTNVVNGLNQAPLARCQVLSGVTSLITITSYTSATQYATPPTEPANITVNCSGSTVSTGNAITLAVSLDGGNTFTAASSLSSFNASSLAAGVYQMVIKLTDTGTGLASLTRFILPVACAGKPAIALSGGPGLSAGADGPGYVNVQLPAASGGGGGPYLYSIDINGDGRFDAYQGPTMSAPSLWNSSNLFSNMYNLYSNYPGATRVMNVQVFDTACNMMGTFALNVDWTKAMPAPLTSAGVQSYYYNQADIGPLTSDDPDPADNVLPYDAMSGPNDPNKHVYCDYQMSGNTGTLHLFSDNFYDDGIKADKGALNQGMDFTVSNISDNGGTANQTTAGLTFSNVDYQTTQSPDGGFLQYTFDKPNGCTVTVNVLHSTAVTPCTNGVSGAQYGATQVYGSYSCTSLSSTVPTARSISVKKGLFFAQCAPVNQCIGGGGGGGGGIPPQGF